MPRAPGRRSTPSSASCAAWRTTRPSWSSPASPSASSAPPRDAPRVLIANALLVPHWATWEQFRELERAGLTMYGQMTAGSWIYIATQGIIQGTYETFAEAARQHFDGTLAGTATLTAGLGGMGGAQPLAVTMNGGAVLAIEVDPARAERRHGSGYVDEVTTDLDEAIGRWTVAQRARGALHRPGGQRRRRRAGARPARMEAGPRHGPDQRPRPAQRLRPRRHAVRGGGGPARVATPTPTWRSPWHPSPTTCGPCSPSRPEAR